MRGWPAAPRGWPISWDAALPSTWAPPARGCVDSLLGPWGLPGIHGGAPGQGYRPCIQLPVSAGTYRTRQLSPERTSFQVEYRPEGYPSSALSAHLWCHRPLSSRLIIDRMAENR
eukprot:8126123-Pyramimonas_sp.AAC.2